MSNKYDKVMMASAHLWAEESYCNKRKVGAILAKDGRILVTGYNGSVHGKPNICEETIYKCPHCGAEETEEQKLVRTQVENSPEDFGYTFKHYCTHCNHLINKWNVPYSSSIADMPLEDINDLHFISTVPPTYRTNEFTVHAEQNVISYAARGGISTEGCTLYVTTAPCKNCAKLIVQSGIKEVVYDETYKYTDGIDFLEKCNIKVRKI